MQNQLLLLNDVDTRNTTNGSTTSSNVDLGITLKLSPDVVTNLFRNNGNSNHHHYGNVSKNTITTAATTTTTTISSLLLCSVDGATKLTPLRRRKVGQDGIQDKDNDILLLRDDDNAKKEIGSGTCLVQLNEEEMESNIVVVDNKNNNKTDGDDDDNNDTQITNEENDNEYENDCDDYISGSSTSSSSSISHSVPESLPIVLIDLQRLIGYQPSTMEELNEICTSIRTTLYGQETIIDPLSNPQSDDSDYHNKDIVKLVAKDFDQLVTEMFESGVASHTISKTITTTTNNNNNNNNDSNSMRFVPIEYPEYLYSISTSKSNNNQIDTIETNDNDIKTFQAFNTERIWKKLLKKRSGIHFVDQMLDLMVYSSSRSLLWKKDMLVAVLDIVYDEEMKIIKKQQSNELMEWKKNIRKEKLNKLYTIRDTFEHKLIEAKIKLQHLHDERENNVKSELRRLRLLNVNNNSNDNNNISNEINTTNNSTCRPGNGMGLEAFDFESTIFAFPDSQLSGNDLFMGFVQEQDDDDNNNEEENSAYYYQPSISDRDEHDNVAEYNADNEEEEEEGFCSDRSQEYDNDDDNLNLNGTIANMLPSKQESMSIKRHQKRKELARKRKEILETAAKEAEHIAKLDAAKTEENRVREYCTTQQYNIQTGVVMSLEGKLQEIDELLESLQEEEWADEEENEEEEESTKIKTNDSVISHNKVHIISNTHVTTSEDEEKSEQNQHPELSLLDEILAMILGGIYPPVDGSRTLKEHIVYLEGLHRSIVEEWKKYFGHLPAPTLSSSVPLSKNQMSASSKADDETEMEQQDQEVSGMKLPDQDPIAIRKSLGIVENNEDTWEDVAEEDNAATATTTTTKSHHPLLKQQTIEPTQVLKSLRPGGGRSKRITG